MAAAQYGMYQSVETITADPGKIVVLLFDGARKFLRQAQHAYQQGDNARYAYSVSKAHAIVGELATSLDRARGGEMSENLGRLYDFMLLHLTQGLIEKNPANVESVLQLLQTLGEGFESAVAASA